MSRDTEPLWVGGWLSQLFLVVCAGVALWFGMNQQACTFAVGATIVGVIRQIERSRTGQGH